MNVVAFDKEKNNWLTVQLKREKTFAKGPKHLLTQAVERLHLGYQITYKQ